MNTTEFPTIDPRPLTGTEQITSTDNTLADYWRWAHSNLIDNAERGALARIHRPRRRGREREPCRVNWDKCDVKSPEGVTMRSQGVGLYSVMAAGTPVGDKLLHQADLRLGQRNQHICLRLRAPVRRIRVLPAEP